LPYVEPLNEARTPLEDFFNILLQGADTRLESDRAPGEAAKNSEEVKIPSWDPTPPMPSEQSRRH
jgi:hypothetical protein